MLGILKQEGDMLGFHQQEGGYVWFAKEGFGLLGLLYQADGCDRIALTGFGILQLLWHDPECLDHSSRIRNARSILAGFETLEFIQQNL